MRKDFAMARVGQWSKRDLNIWTIKPSFSQNKYFIILLFLLLSIRILCFSFISPDACRIQLKVQPETITHRITPIPPQNELLKKLPTNINNRPPSVPRGGNMRHRHCPNTTFRLSPRVAESYTQHAADISPVGQRRHGMGCCWRYKFKKHGRQIY